MDAIHGAWRRRALSSSLALAYKMDAEPPPFLPQVLSSSSHSCPALWTTSDSLDWAPTAKPLHALPLAAGARLRSTSTVLTPFVDRPPSVETHRSSLFLTGDVPKHSLTITSFPARRTLSLVDVHPRPPFIPRLKTTPKVDLCSKSRFKLIYELLL